jgi:hypothetical protein
LENMATLWVRSTRGLRNFLHEGGRGPGMTRGQVVNVRTPSLHTSQQVLTFPRAGLALHNWLPGLIE